MPTCQRADVTMCHDWCRAPQKLCAGVKTYVLILLLFANTRGITPSQAAAAAVSITDLLLRNLETRHKNPKLEPRQKWGTKRSALVADLALPR